MVLLSLKKNTKCSLCSTVADYIFPNYKQDGLKNLPVCHSCVNELIQARVRTFVN